MLEGILVIWIEGESHPCALLRDNAAFGAALPKFGVERLDVVEDGLRRAGEKLRVIGDRGKLVACSKERQELFLSCVYQGDSFV